MRIERGAQVPLTVAAQRCSRPGALTVVAAPRALTVAAQSLQPPRRPHSRCTVAAGPHSRCAALQPPSAPYSRCRSPGPHSRCAALQPSVRVRIAGSGFRKAGEDRSEDRPLTVAAQRCSPPGAEFRAPLTDMHLGACESQPRGNMSVSGYVRSCLCIVAKLSPTSPAKLGLICELSCLPARCRTSYQQTHGPSSFCSLKPPSIDPSSFPGF